MNIRRNFLTLGCAILLALPSAAIAEQFTGRVIDMTGKSLDNTAYFTLSIDEYAEVEEIRGYVKILAEEGQEALEKAFFKLDRGYIRVGAALGYPISVARSIDTEEGRVIRVVTDRPIQMFEVRRGLRSMDYPFGMIEITFGEDGEGEGQLVSASKLEFNDDGVIEMTKLGTRPFKLVQVRREKD